MFVAMEGCCHGELDKIYEVLSYTEQQNNIKVDLLLICGDFQAVRNKSDLKTMAVPPKYQKMNTFYKYYSQEKVAPVLTIFIGGNHEASSFLQELPYGGWVAPNIYYMGYAGVVQFGGVRIGGMSGIYKGQDYHRGHFERPPYNDSTKRSVYHVRSLEVFRLKQLRKPLDIFLSHDWPCGVYDHGNVRELLRKKKFFAQEVASGTLGSPAAQEVLHTLKPAHWFSAHLHVKFPALIEFEPAADGAPRVTKFLALDKCLPGREFLQVLEIQPSIVDQPKELHLDAEWLCILRSTNHLLSVGRNNVYMPGVGSSERYDFTVTDEELDALNGDFDQNLRLPENFQPTADPFDGSSRKSSSEPKILVNQQTTLLCEMVGLTDPFALFLGNPVGGGNISSNWSFDSSSNNSDFIDSTTYNPDEISLDDLDEEKDVDSGDVPVVTLPPEELDLGTASKSDDVDERSENLSSLADSAEVVAHDEQSLVSVDAEQMLVLSSAEQKLDSTEVEQKSVSTDTEQKLVSTITEQKLVLAQVEQKLVSAITEQKLVLAQVEQKLVSTITEQNLVLAQVEQNLVSADVEQNLVSADVEQKSVLAECDQDFVSADKTVNSEAKPKDDLVGIRTIKRRNLAIYKTEEGMADDS